MRVYNPQEGTELHPQLRELLRDLRERRGFDAGSYAQAKAELLNGYMTEHGLRACVVAVSGGIDSAVVLGIVAAAKKLPNSPISRVTAILLPVFDEEAATNQSDATARGRAVCEACGVEPRIVDLSAVHQALKLAVDNALGIEGEAWASGQLVAYARTPAYYYATSLLAQEQLPAIVCGTTNRDEGAYLGYFGKASDGMVDVQLIADLHKSEVYAVAEALRLPREVIEVVPAGDMYDGRIDEEVFGAPYDFVELYLLTKEAGEGHRQPLVPEARTQFDELAARLETLHRYNGHKYLGRSPAVHLNLYTSAVVGGWDR